MIDGISFYLMQLFNGSKLKKFNRLGLEKSQNLNHTIKKFKFKKFRRLGFQIHLKSLKP